MLIVTTSNRRNPCALSQNTECILVQPTPNFHLHLSLSHVPVLAGACKYTGKTKWLTRQDYGQTLSNRSSRISPLESRETLCMHAGMHASFQRSPADGHPQSTQHYVFTSPSPFPTRLTFDSTGLDQTAWIPPNIRQQH